MKKELTPFTKSALERIEGLLTKPANNATFADAGEITLACLNLASAMYGPSSPQVQSIETVRSEVAKTNKTERAKCPVICEQLQGYLRTIASDIKAGRIRDISLQARGEIFGDFVSLAKEALDAGQKDVAAVLACAALEDALKRCAEVDGISVDGKSMSSVIAALKASGAVRGPQGALLQSFVTIRNKAFHAQWDAIDVPDVKSVLAFTEAFLVRHFTPEEA